MGYNRDVNLEFCEGYVFNYKFFKVGVIYR